MKRILVIALLFIFNVYYMPVSADNEDVRPEITSIKAVIKNYKGTQRIKLHIDLASLYAKNENWKDYYKHIRSIYRDCPQLMKSNINFSVPKKKDKPNIIIAPDVIKKLAKINLSYINTQDKALSHLDLLKPLCERICEN